MLINYFDFSSFFEFSARQVKGTVLCNKTMNNLNSNNDHIDFPKGKGYEFIFIFIILFGVGVISFLKPEFTKYNMGIIAAATFGALHLMASNVIAFAYTISSRAQFSKFITPPLLVKCIGVFVLFLGVMKII